jgi:hypothetical protein
MLRLVEMVGTALRTFAHPAAPGTRNYCITWLDH